MALVNVYFSLGSNLGDREANIFDALRRMDEAFGVHYSALSGLIETEPMGFSGGKFLNAAVLYRLPVPERSRRAGGSTPLTNRAEVVLRQVKSIEREMGRTDPPEYDSEGKRVYHSRIIDIDILFYGREIIDIPELTIPHKGIADRPFVMVPLRQIARRSLREAFPEYFKNKR
jgi:2-amino-4-hydroxy-6-hydroxymethyldihydropteridine diphosphokinase